jgi:hypothetical protein
VAYSSLVTKLDFVMKSLLPILLTTVLLSGCSIISPDVPNPLIPVHDRFHGKYNIISSTTDISVDVNLDGNASTDLTTEIPALAVKADEQHYPEYYLELRIGTDHSNGLSPANLLTEWWPAQHIWLGTDKSWQGEPLAYNSALSVGYESGSTIGFFEFSIGFSTINVDTKDGIPLPYRSSKPESITILPNDIIQVVSKRPFYTRQGVKNAMVTTRYKRFTSIT